ncbi:MocR-like pyridoxine biosynthesis transcription factor PdxR [Lentisalinibacter salinarum]|uniref:MocR-like pyridoxine biosynthesis transcription factor PdxR n=1 Tax=Lentisalinibacter salinarum TaxID=2992239 RepID=UPI003864AC7A
MRDTLIYLDPDSQLNLQNQIRRKLVDGILSGALPPGHKLPSSRKLAQQLDVARNTVVLAYQQLIAEGYLVSRARSGIFVSEEMLENRVGYRGEVVPASAAQSEAWQKRTKRPLVASRALAQDLPNWNRYPYPFIDGKFDASLFPLAEWREASRLALSVDDVRQWSAGSGDADDPMLIEEIRSKILSRRGIQAGSDEILITLGTQNSLYLISHLLADASVTAAIEEPGNSEMRELLRQNAARIRPQPVDEEGLVVDRRLEGCDLVYVTPSHQVPTAVLMSAKRRCALLAAAKEHDFLIVEDDYECEINYRDQPIPALRSMDDSGRVIYVASLSKVLAPGIRLGLIVADARFIERARALRRTMMNHPPRNNQRAVAFFLSLGHYDALMLRLGRVLQERRLALRDALNWMRGVPMEISPEVGGTTYWVRTPDHFDVGGFAYDAAQHGILIEPVRHYYAAAENAENCFRMGVTSLPVEQIRPGVTRLVELIRSRVKGQVEQLATTTGEWLTGDDLVRAMSGATILYREVYGAPCTIKYHTDGTMTGVLGYSNEEQDRGHWRIADDVWYRQWSRWNYGEEKGYSIVIDGDQIKWFNADGQMVDSAFILRGTDAAADSDLPAWSITHHQSGPI